MIGENIPPKSVKKNITSKSKSIAASFQVCRRSLPCVMLGYFRANVLVIVVPPGCEIAANGGARLNAPALGAIPSPTHRQCLRAEGGLFPPHGAALGKL